MTFSIILRPVFTQERETLRLSPSAPRDARLRRHSFNALSWKIVRTGSNEHARSIGQARIYCSEVGRVPKLFHVPPGSPEPVSGPSLRTSRNGASSLRVRFVCPGRILFPLNGPELRLSRGL